MKILILNGPNLNLLGKREPEIYGNVSFEAFLPQLRDRFPQHELTYFQSNHEGILIDHLQEADGQYDAVVMNPGAYAHTSIALADCIRAISIPIIEVHISDISKREPYRRHSFTAEACVKCISGLGLEAMRRRLKRFWRRDKSRLYKVKSLSLNSLYFFFLRSTLSKTMLRL